MDVFLALIFTTMSQQYGLPPKLLESVCYVESKYNTDAIHHDDGGANSVGVCQVKLSTAKWLGFKGTEKQLMVPSINVKYAAKYLSYNLKRYSGNKARALTAYNRGNATGLKSSKYSKKVLKRYNQAGK